MGDLTEESVCSALCCRHSTFSAPSAAVRDVRAVKKGDAAGELFVRLRRGNTPSEEECQLYVTAEGKDAFIFSHTRLLSVQSADPNDLGTERLDVKSKTTLTPSQLLVS